MNIPKIDVGEAQGKGGVKDATEESLNHCIFQHEESRSREGKRCAHVHSLRVCQPSDLCLFVGFHELVSRGWCVPLVCVIA